MKQALPTAIVYDWIDKWGGVERVLLYLHKLFPTAEFFTSYTDLDGASWAKQLKIRTSFIQNLPEFIKKNRRRSLPFYPYAFENFDFSNYNLVISVTSSFAKSVITKPKTFHLCYLLTPTRFLWNSSEIYLKKYKVLSSYIEHLKKWDFVAAQRPDKIISISKTASDRCLKYYKRESAVIYPPFDVEYWNSTSPRPPRATLGVNKYFLVVSRLEPYKRVNLVVEAFNQLNKNLVIVGEGSCEKELKAAANKNILFLKKMTDEELAWLYNHAEALIMPQEEDFGYVSLEAQYFGCPVIAFRSGGACETVIENKTGIFFEQQTLAALKDAVARFEKKSYNLKSAVKAMGQTNLEKFAAAAFEKAFFSFLKI